VNVGEEIISRFFSFFDDGPSTIQERKMHFFPFDFPFTREWLAIMGPGFS